MHLHPGISPLTARSRLAARATDAKIRLWRIKHRRVQTAAVVLMSGCLCIRWLGVTANYVPAWAESRSGLMSGCSCIRWPGIGLGDLGGAVSQAEREISFPVPAQWHKKKPPYRLQRIVRYDGSVIIIIIIWQRLPQPQALRPLEVLLLPRMSVQGKVL